MKLTTYLREQSDEEFEIYLQSLADWVGKGGRLAHKGFADHIKKNYGYEKKVSNIPIKTVMDALEDWNYHTEYAILDALMKGNKKAADYLLMIAQEQQKIGHLPSDLGLLRTYVSHMDNLNKWFKGYWENIGKDTYKGMNLSSSTMKIIKKMGKEGKSFLDMVMQDQD